MKAFLSDQDARRRNLAADFFGQRLNSLNEAKRILAETEKEGIHVWPIPGYPGLGLNCYEASALAEALSAFVAD